MKTLSIIVSLFFMLVLVSHFSFAEEKSRLTGLDFLNLTEPERSRVVADIRSIYLRLAEEPEYEAHCLWLACCIKGMNRVQLATLAAKYLKDNPHTWYLSFFESLDNAIEQACRRLSSY